jgi:predicted AlkP superfamily phosphohydrolase/phosphomutase
MSKPPGAKSASELWHGGADHPVDWSRTRAFALGLGQIFLNVEDRQPHGIVPAGDVRALREEIRTKLLAVRNPDRPDEVPIPRVFFLQDEYRGPHAHEAGDLQIGFGPGYRVSWQTALLGQGLSGHVFEPNGKPWSGDHCSTDPATVPGVLLVNRPLPPAPDGAPYHVRDVAATVMAHFGIDLGDLVWEGRPDSRPLPFAPAR